ncbi:MULTISPECIES: FMN-binding negative transcriptional regulator [unclassified Streptomyces]|uniref:FMN-binding negative transcriptional regulator n=1 Tax=Streptomyces sp. R33 TaxID=3238629 RepID=A0AB39YI84_9ACTN|nr:MULTISPECIES: FMN-binding negative transcriptional regulator [unclassified Streptomyces]KJY47102.1 transcriptional regulator [Streptomyces sp. NRRL S-444]KOY55944.1 transcriptional regulator [Streptomyces sp. XY332]TDU69105.1 PaiB family negative transcriptional regulator [Streptomyces sp. KS 21]THA33236.1 FMN-binding negative transcriptional regulator [Streptomyces sp. A1547]
MFVPSSYREPDSSWMVDLIRGNPLALAVANGSPENGPFATHLPVIFDPETSGDWSGELPGATLLGHMNRANPHWSALETGGVLLLTFTGPHSYVSPTVYQKTPAAPTWNFTAVHVRGVVEKIDSMDETLGVVESTVRAFEGRFGNGWDMTESLGYFRKIAPAVGAFRFTVTGAEGMFKLSQEQPDEVRDRVQESFAQSACTYKRETAGLMSQLS